MWPSISSNSETLSSCLSSTGSRILLIIPVSSAGLFSAQCSFLWIELQPADDCLQSLRHLAVQR